MNWTGFYLGAQIGYGYGDNDGSITYATPGGLAGQSNLGSSAIIAGGGNNINGDAIGVIGGVHLGYNKQFDKWVVGVEGAVDPTLMSRNVSVNVPNSAADPTGALGIGATATGSIWSTIQGSVRARAGYAFDRMLFYGTGGVALGAFGSNFQIYGTDTTLAPFYAADQRSVDARWLDARRRRRIRRQPALVGQRRISLHGFRPYGRFARRFFDGRGLRSRPPSRSEPGAGWVELQVRRGRFDRSRSRQILTSVLPSPRLRGEGQDEGSKRLKPRQLRHLTERETA